MCIRDSTGTVSSLELSDRYFFKEYMGVHPSFVSPDDVNKIFISYTSKIWIIFLLFHLTLPQRKVAMHSFSVNAFLLFGNSNEAKLKFIITDGKDK